MRITFCNLYTVLLHLFPSHFGPYENVLLFFLLQCREMWPCVPTLFFTLLLVSSNRGYGQEEEEEEDYDNPSESVLQDIKPTSKSLLCPKDCTCTQEGVVDCAGVDLKEFPIDLPEFTNHLSLQV